MEFNTQLMSDRKGKNKPTSTASRRMKCGKEEKETTMIMSTDREKRSRRREGEAWL